MCYGNIKYCVSCCNLDTATLLVIDTYRLSCFFVSVSFWDFCIWSKICPHLTSTNQWEPSEVNEIFLKIFLEQIKGFVTFKNIGVFFNLWKWYMWGTNTLKTIHFSFPESKISKVNLWIEGKNKSILTEKISSKPLIWENFTLEWDAIESTFIITLKSQCLYYLEMLTDCSAMYIQRFMPRNHGCIPNVHLKIKFIWVAENPERPTQSLAFKTILLMTWDQLSCYRTQLEEKSLSLLLSYH